MKRYCIYGSKFIACLVLSILTAAGLMILLYRLPTAPIKANVWRSHYIYDYEGSYPQWAAEYKMTQLDNVTDGYMLLEAMFAGEDDPVRNAMNNPYTVYEGVNPDKAAVLESHNTEGASGRGEHGRYWHGYLLFLKPLLSFLEVSDLRIMNMILCLGLSFYFIRLTEITLGKKTMAAVMTSWLILNPVSIIMSFQFSTSFYVMLLASILVLKRHGWLSQRGRYGYFFLFIGIVTNFVDFLTYPIVAMAVPLILSVLLEEKRGRKESGPQMQQFQHTGINRLCGSHSIQVLLKCIFRSFAWLFGYAGMWLGKWIMGTLLTGQSFIADAFNEAKVQSTGQDEIYGVSVSPLGSILKNVRVIVKWPFILLFLFILLFITLGILCRKLALVRGRRSCSLALIAVGLYPVVWYSLLQVHSITCYWFTYRNLSVTVLAGMVLMMYRVKTQKHSD